MSREAGMYLNYYNLSENPFDLTPDPKFFFARKQHLDVISELEQGIMDRKGVMLLTGEVGTGKTMVVHALLESLIENIGKAYVSFFTGLKFDTLLASVAEQLGQPVRDDNRPIHLGALESYLKERTPGGMNFILVLDEAQNIPINSYEDFRQLSNIETSNQKLIQLLLVGQPELNENLKYPKLLNFKQRVAVKCELGPFTVDETGDYIRHRLERAGAPQSEIFSSKAVEHVFIYSKGIPRLINVICDNALSLGSKNNQKTISKKIILQAIRKLEGSTAEEMAHDPGVQVREFKKRKKKKRLLMVGGIAAALIIIVTAAYMAFRFGQRSIYRGRQAQTGVQSEVPVDILKADTGTMDRPEEPGANTPDEETETKPAGNLEETAPVADSIPAADEGVTDGTHPGENLRTHIIRVGECLSDIEEAYYGIFSDDITRQILQHNPRITDINLIEAGETLYLPEILEDGNTGEE